MTPAELTAYRTLCQRWPECDVGAIDAYTDTACPESIRDWSIIGHLETLLDKHAMGWSYHAPKPASRRPPAHNYRGIRGPLGVRSIWHNSRLSALIAACVAVLTAKGTNDA